MDTCQPVSVEKLPIRPLTPRPRTVNEASEERTRPDIAKLTEGSKKGLTRREQAFILYYLQGKPPVTAARLAGYSESSASLACYILERPQVVREINRRTRAKFRLLELDAEKVIDETTKLAFSNVLDYVDIEEDGSFKVDLTKITRDQAAAIQELVHDQVGRARLRLYDKKSALELLARFIKVEKDPSPNENRAITIASLDTLIEKHQNIVIHQTNIYSSGERQETPKTIEGT